MTSWDSANRMMISPDYLRDLALKLSQASKRSADRDAADFLEGTSAELMEKARELEEERATAARATRTR